MLKSLTFRTQIWVALFSIGFSPVFGQSIFDTVPFTEQTGNDPVDTLIKEFPLTDTFESNIFLDLLDSMTQPQPLLVSKDTFSSEIDYSASDSILYDLANELAFLYGDAKVNYETIELTAEFIVFDMKNKIVTAYGREDSLGGLIGQPIFTEGDQSFAAEVINYNFKTKKGKIEKVLTREGEGYLHVDSVKQIRAKEFFGAGARYTTCDLADPHFHIQANKVKVVTDELIVTSKAQFFVEDVPTPLILPFGIFPLQKGRTSGIIFPAYGQSPSRGFYLNTGGYYFALNDYMDLQVAGDIYATGSWAVKPTFRYKKRYKYGGSLNLNYAVNKSGSRFDENFSKSTDFQVNWRHNQDPKARPNSRFTAAVKFGTSSYDKNNSFDNNQVLNNTYNSSITWQKTWPGSPFSLTVAGSHNQNTSSGLVSVNLPDINFAMSQIRPLQRKERTGPAKWYENLTLRYNLSASNQYSTVDTLFLKDNYYEQFRNGIRHTAPLALNLKLLKYFQLSPSFTYNEVWYLRSIEKDYDVSTSSIVTDTINAFARAGWFSTGASLNTKLYGTWNFGKKIKAIRHTLTPSAAFTYRPDFSLPGYGYYKSYTIDPDPTEYSYSIFEQGLYGGPPSGEEQRLGLSLNSIFEAKVLNRKDSVTSYKKVKLLDYLNLSSSYNLAADSLQMADISLSAGASFFNRQLNLRWSSSFDPYVYDTVNNRTINQFEWDVNRNPARLDRASLSASVSLRSSNRPSLQDKLNEETLTELGPPGGYVDFTVPFNASLNYTLNASRLNSIKPDSFNITQSLSGNIDMNITSKWKVVLNAGYDFRYKELTRPQIDIYRDLHCWEINFSLVPTGSYQYYNFTLRAKASVLQDLKLNRKRNWQDYIF